MKKYPPIKKILLGLLTVMVILGGLNIQPKQVYAIPVTVVANSSPTAIQDTINIYAQKIKSFLLDGVAWHVAKLMVQQITADTVQWINSGFKGSPAFLTNPGGFFANVADQETGAFIANTGILSGLCSPFNVDVRLSLALGEAGYGDQEKYTCTLDSVIKNVQNSTVNGYTIQGFMKGDFKQGGWPAFISISDPNNNAMGTYLQAQSELNQQIGSQQGAVNQQLTQGSGFLSWQSCTDVTPAQAQAVAGMTGNAATLSSFQNAANQNTVNTIAANANQSNLFPSQSTQFVPGGTTLTSGSAPLAAAPAPSLNLGNNSSIQTSVGANGQTSYQDCQTETPGSVINSQLEKQLGSGVDQLNLANSINEIVDALFSQLVSKILHAGLASVSQKPSNETQSAILQLSAEANSQSEYSNDSSNIQSTLAPYAVSAQQISNIYTQAVNAFETAKNDYGSAHACFTDLSISNINPANESIITTDTNNIISDLTSLGQDEQTYQTSLFTANNNLMFIQEQVQSASTISSPTQLQSATQSIQNFISSQPNPSTGDALTTAQSDLTTAQGLASSYDTKAKSYLSTCQSMGGN